MNATEQFHYDEETRIHRVGIRVIPSVTQCLLIAGITGDFLPGEKYLHRGKAVHKATELLDRGTLDWSTVADEYLPYVRGYQEFLKTSNAQVRENELVLYSGHYQFCGRIDRVMWINGKLSIVDIKTGKSPEWAGLQTAGYALLYSNQPQSLQRYSLELPGDGRYNLKPHTDPGDLNTFIGTLAVAHWKLTKRYEIAGTEEQNG